jgi:gas vesicle protein
MLSQEDNKVPNQSSSVDPSKEILRLALKDLQEKRCRLEQEIETLEKRKQTVEKEVSRTFSGQSDSIARRVKGFQEYLAGALQDLSNSVEQLDLIAKPVIVTPSPLDQTKAKESEEEKKEEVIVASSAIADTFKPDKELILQLLGQYLQGPDYYADPWKFRRSLEPQDAEILEDWFFNMGGRGAQPSRGNRPRNVLVSAALIAILGELYGDRFQALVLASQPERLGEWRRGLQDALGLNREDFGPNSGVVLFERSEPLIERADRLEAANEVPLILIDASEQSIEIPILQFPIWLTFAATPDELYIEEELI